MVNHPKWKTALILPALLLAASCGGGGGGGTGAPAPPAGLGICTNAASLVPNTFIVEVKISDDTLPEVEIELEIEDAAEDNRLRLSGETRHLLKKALRGFVTVLPEGVSPERLFEDDRVLRVEQDVAATADATLSSGRAVNIFVQEVPAGVRRIHAAGPAPAGLGGVGIAILDSGIDLEHPDLNVSLLGADLTSSPVGADDIFGHGTHVAGIAAARDDNGIGVVGVAPGATLYPVKVLGDDGNGTMSDIIAGLDWVVANADKVPVPIAVANMSLYVTCPSPLLRDAVARAVAAGVVVVASAGNNTDDLYGVDGIYGNVDDRAPGCFPEALTVSAMADFDGLPGGLAPGVGQEQDDTLVSFSNRSASLYPGATWTPPGLGIDLAAPGFAILSTYPGGLYETMSGTSMAAPHVSGVIARRFATGGRDLNLDGAVNAADVALLRQSLVGGGEPQDQWRAGVSALDPDGNPEPLVDARTP